MPFLEKGAVQRSRRVTCRLSAFLIQRRTWIRPTKAKRTLTCRPSPVSCQSYHCIRSKDAATLELCYGFIPKERDFLSLAYFHLLPTFSFSFYAMARDSLRASTSRFLSRLPSALEPKHTQMGPFTHEVRTRAYTQTHTNTQTQINTDKHTPRPDKVWCTLTPC